MKAPHHYAWPEALLPWVVAESVCEEAGRYLGVAVPRRRARWLAAKAEVCFQGNARFRRRMRGAAAVEWLRVFMRHWLASLLKIERADLWQALPDTFDLGHPLPAARQTRRNRRQSGPLPAGRGWNPRLVLSCRSWQFLAPVSPSRRPTLPAPAPSWTPLPHEALHEYPIC